MVDRLGPQLDETMTMSKFLQDRAALGVRPINAREFVLEQKIKNCFRIAPVGFLSGASPLANLGGVANPDFVFEFKEQIFKPLGVAGGFQPNDHRSVERSIKGADLLDLRVIEFNDLNFAVGCVAPNDELLPGVKINATICWHSDSFHFSILFNREDNNSRRRESHASSHQIFCILWKSLLRRRSGSLTLVSLLSLMNMPR